MQDLEIDGTVNNHTGTERDIAAHNGSIDLSSSQINEFLESAATEALPQSQSSQEAQPFVPIDSLARLITGLIMEGGDELLAILKTSEAKSKTEQLTNAKPSEDLNPAEKAGFIMLGILFESIDQTRKMVNQAVRFSADVAQTVENAIDPLTDNFLMRPVKNRYLEIKTQADETLQRWFELGRSEDPQARAIARATTNQIIDRVVEHLESSDSTEALVRTQADAYIQFMLENPDLANTLVEAQADQYLQHVQENPELMQALIQDQSLGMAAELMDEVRERTVTADTIIERFVRGIFRKQPRTSETSPEVRRLAERTMGSAPSTNPQLPEEIE